jgi:exodeoxyribonuclease V gamma subunit
MASIHSYSSNYKFHLISSNRLESLAKSLANTLGEKRKVNVLQTENIIVQSRGMERWLHMQLAKLNGISANIKFPFPRTFISDYIFDPLLDGKKENLLSPKVYAWKIYNALPGLINSDADFKPLATFLNDDFESLKALQLSERLANLFEQYLIFRPDLIRQWSSKRNPLGSFESGIWQYKLWSQVTADCQNETTFANLYDSFMCSSNPKLYGKDNNNFKADFSKLKNLKRVFLFGFSAMAPAFIDIYFALSKYVDVYFYYLNPSASEWEYDLSERGKLKFLLGNLNSTVAKADLKNDYQLQECLESAMGSYDEQANSLLASLGAQGREFFGLLNAADIEGETIFNQEAREFSSLLASIQADIQENRSGNCDFKLPESDNSIQIHSCHSSMREVEILLENITHFFEQDKSLLPNDIIVLLPDVELYAPYIEAVFQSLAEDDPRRMAITIADRKSLSSMREAKAFIAILKLLNSRFAVSEVLAILEAPIVATNFNLDEVALIQLNSYLQQAGVAWGTDGKFRQTTTKINFAQGSWEFGLDRMFAGFAFGDELDDKKILHRIESNDDEVLPLYCCDGENVKNLGELSCFIERLKRLKAKLSSIKSTSIEEWEKLLLNIVEQFFSKNSEFERNVSNLKTTIAEFISALYQAEDYSKKEKIKLNIELITYQLEHYFQSTVLGGGFLRGGITFCEAKPLRSVPAKVICMLGMDEKSFPRIDKQLSFDLMANRPRFGDRSARNDDRYLFLETLLSARQMFYISYVGQGIKDNEPRPESVVVSELIDYVKQNYKNDSLTIKHPLQPFSWEYFSDDSDKKLISYSKDNAKAAIAYQNSLTNNISVKNRIVSSMEPLTINEDLLNISIDQFSEFFINPARYFLRHCLQVNPDIYTADELIDSESFELDSLAHYQLATDLLQEKIDCWPTLNIAEFELSCKKQLHAANLIPVGAWGDVKFEQFFATFLPFANRVAAHASGKRKKITQEITLDCDVVLQLDSENFYSDNSQKLRLLDFAYSSKNNCHKRLVKSSLTLLAAIATGENITQADLVGKDYLFNLPSGGKADATMRLEALGKIYRQGLKQAMLFSPAAAAAYFNTVQKNSEDHNIALVKATSTLKNKSWGSSKDIAIDPALKLCFGEAFTLGEEFACLAKELVPLLYLDAKSASIKEKF